MSKHVLYDADEVQERMKHEFEEGIKALDSLEVEIREVLDALTGSFPLTGTPQRRPQEGQSVAVTSPDAQRAADLVAQALAGGKPGK